MQLHGWTVLILLIVAIGVTGCVVQPVQPVETAVAEPTAAFAPGVQCIDFVDVALGDLPDPVFEKNEFVLGPINPSDLPLVVTDFAPAGQGLWIKGDGIHVEWPAPAQLVVVTAGSWSGAPLDVSAVDELGNFVCTATIPPMDSVLTVGCTGNDIHIVDIVGGGNEGLLTEICIGIGDE